jgi:hypothetical protein
MPSENGHEGSTDADTGSEGPRRQHRQILKRDAAFIELAGGVWFAILFAASAWLEESHRYASTFLFLAASVGAIFVVYIHGRHVRDGKRKIIWRTIGSFGAAQFVFLALAAVMFFRAAGTAPPFHIEAAAAIVMGEPPSATRVTPFVVASPSMNGSILRPVRRMQYLLLVNNSKSKRMVLRYGLAVETGRGLFGSTWTDLCRVDLRGRSLLEMTGDPKQAGAREISTENSLDRGLVNQMLAPGEARSGWSLWNCPADEEEACGPGAKRLRLTLYDSEGETSEYILPSDSKADMLTSALKFSPAITDLTGTQWAPTKLCD